MKQTPLLQACLKHLLNIFGLVYIYLEKYIKYPDDLEILGVNLDRDLYNMNRKQLCRYMDAVLPKSGFFNLQSTTKIRLGCQLLRNFHLIKKELRQTSMKYDTSTAYNPLEKN